MHFAAGRNAFVGRIWPAGCSLETPDIEYEEWWEYTPLSESSSTVNGCNLTPSTCTPIVNGNTVTWRPVTDGLQHHRLLLQHSPKLFTTQSCTFLRSTKHVYTSLACSQNFSKICWSGILFCCAAATTKAALGIFQLWFNYFAASCRSSWCIHSCLSNCVSGWSVWPFGALAKRHATWHILYESIKPSGVLNSHNSHSNLSRSSLSSNFSSGIRQLIDAQFYGSFHLC